MRTALFLLAGCLLMAASLLLARLFGTEIPGARLWLPALAIVCWLGLTGFNMWVGVTHAGYSVRDELPIFLLLFAVPSIAVWLARRWVA